MDSITITVNDKEITLPADANLAQALEACEISPNGIATALNGSVVKASMRAETALSDGDKILVIKAFYGG